LADADGTLIFERDHLNDIKTSEGSASIRSLKLQQFYPVLEAAASIGPGEVRLVDAESEMVAISKIPETPWILAIHFPVRLMRPAVIQNFAIVIATGLLTLLVEIFIIRSVLIRQVSRPLERLIRAVNLVGKSHEQPDSGDLPIGAQDEIGELARDFHGMAKRIFEARVQLEEKVRERTEALQDANLKLIELSITDPLTGIANRRRFDDVFHAEWNRSKRSGSAITLAMLDVDYFKKYNDCYGHVAGDECLKRITGILKGAARRSSDLVARYGGEEFVLLLVEEGDHGDLIAKIQEELKMLALPHADSPFGVVTVSIGWATLMPSRGSRAETLVELADKALYAAKNSGRNRSVAG
jgi:diguanylate cyclase (GGDEF)-like protein